MIVNFDYKVLGVRLCVDFGGGLKIPQACLYSHYGGGCHHHTTRHHDVGAGHSSTLSVV